MASRIMKKLLLISFSLTVLSIPFFLTPNTARAATGIDDNQAVGGNQGNNGISLGKQGSHQCGNLPDPDDNWKTKINFGCLGRNAPNGMGPIQDLLFALIRFLSIGVGVIITLSIVAAGIQYATAEGNAEATQKSKKRIQNAVIGLAIYIFAFSAMQFLIPGGLFKPGFWLQDIIFLKLWSIP